MLRPVVLIAAVAACSAKKDAPATAVRADAGPAKVSAPEPLPPADPTAPIGERGPAILLDSDDAGVWQVLCQGDHLQIVVGGGPGFEAEQLHASAPNDLVVQTSRSAVHVDIVARTTQRFPGVGAAAIDADTRRVVLAVGDDLIVRDPGKAPRTIPAGGHVVAVRLSAARWAEVAIDTRAQYPQDCAVAQWPYSPESTALVDLDPVGVEAVDRVGPQVGVTRSGEITIAGEVVIGADCVGTVLAALAEPPRVLAQCNGERHDYVIGQPGAPEKSLGYAAGAGGALATATISDQLILGERLVCVYGECIDLVGGTSFDTFGDHSLVTGTPERIVRVDPKGLRVDDVVRGTHEIITLPKLTQAVTVDAVTGRRKVGSPPPAALHAIDVAGDFLLYGPFVVDLASAKVTLVLEGSAVAVDRTGRALVPIAPNYGPMTWIAP